MVALYASSPAMPIAARYAAMCGGVPRLAHYVGDHGGRYERRRRQGTIIDGSALTSSKTTSDVGAAEVSPSCRYPIGVVPSDWVPVSWATGEPSSQTEISPDVPLIDPNICSVCQDPRDTAVELVVETPVMSLRKPSLPVELTYSAAIAPFAAVRKRSR